MMGGNDGTQYLSDVWKSEDGVTWAQIGTMDTPRSSFGLTIFSG